MEITSLTFPQGIVFDVVVGDARPFAERLQEGDERDPRLRELVFHMGRNLFVSPAFDELLALQVKASCRGFELTFDEPVEVGGASTGMSPLKGVLRTLGACQSIAAMIFVRAQGAQLDSVRMEVVGDADPDGFMGINPDVRNGLFDVRCKLIVSGPDKDTVRKIAEMAEQRCPVSDSIQSPIPVSCEIVVE